MLDDLMFSEEELNEVTNPTQPSTTGFNEQKKNNYSNNSGGGNNNWRNREEVVEDPYLPVTIFIDRDFPEEIKQKLVSIASKFINKGYTVRYNGDDKNLHNSIHAFSSKLTEAYVPWKGFEEIDSKLSWNTKTANHIAQENFPAWDKIPNLVKAMMARNVRLIFGSRNNSPTKVVITWSPDGATRYPEVTRDTGRSSFIISVASKYTFPVINIQKEGAEEAMEKAFGLQE